MIYLVSFETISEKKCFNFFERRLKKSFSGQIGLPVKRQNRKTPKNLNLVRRIFVKRQNLIYLETLLFLMQIYFIGENK
jgi:hypothetical protein